MVQQYTAQHQKKRIAIFASGAGSNAQKIIDHFHGGRPVTAVQNGIEVEVVLIVSNNPTAGVLQIAEKENIPSLIIERKQFLEDGYINKLKEYHTDLLVLAGFLWKVPAILTKSYRNKIINIHPALLPKYGGKGMYGSHVHQAVINSKENQSGITIHYVDEIYDHGNIIFQVKCEVDENDTADSLANKIHALEHRYYPDVIESILQQK
jgi:phosphoribosylglycinamide formyltransferase-1